jgi:HK97 family phage prohead protease
VEETMTKVETRINPVEFELRETDGGGMAFTGYAAVFDSPSEPLPFTERVAPGAFKRTLAARNDVKMLWNHDAGEVLGSTRAKTMTLVEDGRGLLVNAELPDTTRGRDVAELLKRGDVDSMSFGFTTLRDSWDAEGNNRTLQSVRLHEVSVVSFPAYRATSGTTSVRSLYRLAYRASVDPTLLAEALLKIESGEEISQDDRAIVTAVLDELAPLKDVVTFESEPPPSILGDIGLLELKKAKLKVLEYGNG